MDWGLRNNSLSSNSVRSPLDRETVMTSFSPAVAPPSIASPKGGSVAGLAGGPPMMMFRQRFQALQQASDSYDGLIQDILHYAAEIEAALSDKNEQLAKQVHDLQLDVENQTQSRRSMQQNMNQLKLQAEDLLLENNRLKHHNPYVLALIDGDGLIFQQSYLRMGAQGGQRAALTLRNAIASVMGEKGDEVEIMVKIMANLSGLATALRRDGSVESEMVVRDFFLGFCQAKATFDFVDVGNIKVRGDSKIKELTKWHLRNPNCKQVLLGISHDAGYVPFLDGIIRDEQTKRTITIIEGIPSVQELRPFALHTLNWTENLFRSEKLVDLGRDIPTPPAISNLAPMQQPISSPPSAPQLHQPIARPSSSASSSLANNHNSTSAKAKKQPEPRGASPPPQITLPLAKQQQQTNKSSKRGSSGGSGGGGGGATAQTVSRKAQQPPWNPGARGLDPHIPIVPAILDSIKRRKDGDKLCNNHYLRGPCAKRDTCGFEHNYPANKEEKNAIALLTRLNPCTSGQECEVEDCIYGHHCPSVKDGFCTHPYCKFKVDEHPPGTKFKNSKIKDN